MQAALRADEDEAGRFDPLRELGVFRQEAVAGMDRLRAADLGGEQDRGRFR